MTTVINDSSITLSPMPGLAYGSLIDDCGGEAPHVASVKSGDKLIDTSIEIKVDDHHAPDHFLVDGTYGLYYKHEGWVYNSYQLKLQPASNGDLHYDMIDGHDGNLLSKDQLVQAGPVIRYTHAYRIYFYCLATYNDGGKKLLAQNQTSLCLKTA